MYFSRENGHLSRFSRCHAERVVLNNCIGQVNLLVSQAKDKRRRKRNEEQIRQPEVPELLRLRSFLSLSSSLSSSKSYGGHETSWKYEGADGIVFNEVWPPSCTCHFRGISDQRPLHRLEHPTRNWREPRSQESVRLNSYLATASSSFPSFRLRPIVRWTRVAIARCYNRTRRKDSHVVTTSFSQFHSQVIL